MSNKKQSSVEYLIKEFSEILGPIKTQPMQDLLLTDAINKAKAMHKSEVTEAFYIGRYEYNNFDSNSTEYYTETFGNNTP